MAKAVFTKEGARYTRLDEDYLLLEKRRSLFIVRKELMASGFRKRLGNFWLMLDPLFYSMIYYFVFAVVRSNPSASSIIIGIGLMRVFQESFRAGSDSPKTFSGGLKAERIRTSVLVRSMVQSRILNTFFQSFGLSLVLALALGMELVVSIYFLIICQIVAILAQGIALNLSMLTRRIPDVSNAVRYFLILYFYMSPALYPLSKTSGLHYKINSVNPFSFFVEWIRMIANLDSEYNNLDQSIFILLLAILSLVSIIGFRSVDKNRWVLSTWS